MKNIIKKWDKNGGKGIFIIDQDLSRVCNSEGVYHIDV